MNPEVWRKETTIDKPKIAAWRTDDDANVLCLHGISSQHRSFNALASNLSSGLVAPDLRGRGDSEKPDSGYGLAAHSSDVLRVLDLLGLQKPVVCGHSMGAFVAMKFALDHPNRLSALVLLDGGWPREENPDEIPEEEAKALADGLSRAFSRLDRTFASHGEYLDFWFPGQNLEPEDLPPDLADYYLYDLANVEGGYRPKASRKAAEEDSAAVANEALSAPEMRNIECPVALVRAAEGFFPGSAPLVSDEARDAMTAVLDVKREVFLPGANHYTMMWQPHVESWSGLLSDLSWTEE